MPFFADTGFYKRAQITAHDLHLAGVVAYPDIDRLTIFADNLVPHVLRARRRPALRRRAGRGSSTPGPSCPPAASTSARCARAPCTPARRLARRAGVPAATLDNWLWNRGRELRWPARTSPAPCTTDAHGRLRAPRRRSRVPDVHRHVARGRRRAARAAWSGSRPRPASTRRASSSASRTRTARSATAVTRSCSASTPSPPTPRTWPSCSAARPATRWTSSSAPRGATSTASRSSTAVRTGSPAVCSSASTPATTTRICWSRSKPGSGGQDEFTFHRAKRIDPGHAA